MATQGFFVTVEGGEGVGKSSFCLNLREALESRGVSVYATREPGGTQLGQQIRQLFLAPPGGEAIDGLTELMLVCAARRHHVAGPIRQQLDAGRLVLCDRFVDSSVVYQGFLGQVDQAFVERLNEAAIDETRPDVTFLLDCDISVAKQRLEARGATEKASRFDLCPDDFHQRVRESFLKVATSDPRRVVVLDASLAADKVCEAALAHLERLGIGRSS